MTKKNQPGIWEAINALNSKFNTVVNKLTNDHAAELAERDAVIADLRNQVDTLQETVSNIDVATGIENANLVTNDALQDLAEITVTVQDLTPVREALQELRDETGSAYNDLNDRMGPLSKTLDTIMDTIDTLSERINGGTDRENAIRADINSLCGRVTEIFGFVEGFEHIRAEITQEIADGCKDITDRFVDTFDNITRTLDSSADAIKSHKQELERIDDRLTEETKVINGQIGDTVAAFKEKFDTVKTENLSTIDFVAGVRDDLRTHTDREIENLNKRISATMCSLPKNLVINSEGDLVGIDANGDTTIIGKVGGNVIDAKIHNNKLTLHLSDGRKIDAGSVVDLKPKKSEAEQKKDRFIKWFENKPETDKVDIKSEAKKYGVTIQTIYRWINASGKRAQVPGRETSGKTS